VQENVDDQQEAEPGSGEGVTIGYATSLETVPVVHVISEGIKEQAEKAGVELIFCDTGGDVTKALDCANTFKTRGVQGVLQFQHVTDASPSICAAGPQDVPTFAIDIPQPPCQTTFMGVDNAYGGYVAGVKAGETMKEQFNCEYDAWVSLEQPEIGEPNEQRMGGYREGFQSVCPGEIKNLKKVGFDATLTQAQTLMTDVLTTPAGFLSVGNVVGMQYGTGMGWISPDGITWTRSGNEPAMGQSEPLAIATDGTRVVAVGSFGAPDNYIPQVWLTPPA